MFTPQLSLQSTGANAFRLIAETETPDTCFTSARVILGPPPTHPIGGNVLPFQLVLAHAGQICQPKITLVRHIIPDVQASIGTVITAFVVLDEHVLGSSSIVVTEKGHVPLPTMFRVSAVAGLSSLADRPPLSSALTQNIVIRNTPKPQNFQNSQQLLVELGIIDADQITMHKAGIQHDLNSLGYKIAQSTIQSATDKKVHECAASVQDNAF